MNLKEKIGVGVLAATTAIGGAIASRSISPPSPTSPSPNITNLNDYPICLGDMSLTGNGIKQDNQQWQITFANLPSNPPCKLGPIKAIFPRYSVNYGKDPLTVINQKVFIIIE